MKTLFVRNLPFTATDTELRKAFEVFGKVHRCSIAKNRDTGESRGFGFIDMDDDAGAKAILEMNGRGFGNRNIIVQESDPKSRTGAGGGAPTGGGAPMRSGPPGAGAPRPMGARPPMGSGPRPGGDGPRPASSHGPQDGPRTAGPGGGPTGPRAATSRPKDPASGPGNRSFGANAAPAADRNKQYHAKPKNRLDPYKRGHFDFREALEDEEEGKKPKGDDEGGDSGE